MNAKQQVLFNDLIHNFAAENLSVQGSIQLVIEGASILHMLMPNGFDISIDLSDMSVLRITEAVEEGVADRTKFYDEAQGCAPTRPEYREYLQNRRLISAHDGPYAAEMIPFLLFKLGI